MDLSVVIPAYNEENRIGRTLERLGSYFAGKDSVKKEILIVVNNTTDGTIEVIKQYRGKFPFIKFINIPRFTGKGGAISVGFRKASGKYVAFMDADGASSPSELMKLFRKIKNSDVDSVIASRYLNRSRIFGEIPFYRKIYTKLFNLVTRVFFDLNNADTQCGLKIFTNELAKEISGKIYSVTWTVDLNMLLICKHLNKKVLEVSTLWSAKDGSKLNVRKAWKYVPKELITLKVLEIGLLLKSTRNLLSKNPELRYRAVIN